jgi:hypothetical protein
VLNFNGLAVFGYPMNSQLVTTDRVEDLVRSIAGEDMHTKRVTSVSNAVIGVVHAAALSIHAIGQALAQAAGLNAKHAVKQVDRLLSNSNLDVWEFFERWIAYVVAQRPEIVVSMDWTEFDADDQSTIAINLVTRHGRATPLLWKTVEKSTLKGKRNGYEDEALLRLREVLPKGTKVTVLADRGFGDHKLYELCSQLGFDYIIRFRANVRVEDRSGVACPAGDWVMNHSRPKVLRDARVTAERYQVGAVVTIKAPGMKDAWLLACSQADIPGAEAVKMYGRRFTIEETFRDQKDARYGMGLSATRIGNPERRDRLMLIFAIAATLITLLGAAGESLGMDRMLKANTVKKRTHSLLTQGRYYYGAIPMMREERLAPLVRRFGELVLEQRIFSEIFGLI